MGRRRKNRRARGAGRSMEPRASGERTPMQRATPPPVADAQTGRWWSSSQMLICGSRPIVWAGLMVTALRCGNSHVWMPWLIAGGLLYLGVIEGTITFGRRNKA